MSDQPGEGGDFFSRIPLFREFARLLSGEPGPVNWELARQVAVATAIGADTLGEAPALPVPKFSPEPGEQRAWDDHLRLAELWVDPVSSLPGPGHPLVAQPTSRADWAEAALRGFRPLIEPGASRMADSLGPGAGAGVPPEMGQMVGRLGGLIVGLQVGTVVGQLSQLVLSQYDLAMPAKDRGRLVFLSENVQAFEQSSGLPRDQLRLWLACHEVIRQRLLTGVPWFEEHLYRLVKEMAALTEPDPSGLMDRLQTLDMNRPESIQELLEGGEGLTSPPSPALQAATARLEVLLALADGYALVLSERVLAGRLPALPSIQAAVRVRMADEEGAHALFAQLLRAGPERAGAARGERFCREVLAATDVDGLDRVWAHPDFLPTPEELASPGRWLERAGLVGGEEIGLDEGLRALLEGESGPPGDEPPAESGGPPGEPGSGGPGSGGSSGEPGSGGPRRPEDAGGQ
ncbi:MAG TPA: zinc-dependent metalloprotease [Actinomycetota bacterium]|jgi:putative hydrolase|nr:zinc-dependent metalloprotease [Actinomycetota bacterium]